MPMPGRKALGGGPGTLNIITQIQGMHSCALSIKYKIIKTTNTLSRMSLILVWVCVWMWFTLKIFGKSYPKVMPLDV